MSDEAKAKMMAEFFGENYKPEPTRPVQYKRENPSGFVKQIASAPMHTPPGVVGVVKFCPVCSTRHRSPLPIGCQNCGTTL